MSLALIPPEGVPVRAWLKLAIAEKNRWKIVERNACGEVIGTAYRLPDGSKDGKAGGKRGLIVAWPLPTYAGTSPTDPVYVCEGASDTAALLGLDLDAVGIPMAGQCGEMLADLLSDRHAVIVSDADAAGRIGTSKIAQALLSQCASVRTIEPPNGAKDAREAVIAGSDADAFRTLAAVAEVVAPVPTDSFQSLRKPTGRNESAPYTLVSIADLGPAQEPDWLWPGYLARGALTLLTGLWKAGKTTLMGYLLRDLYRGDGLVISQIDAPTIYWSEEPPTLWTSRRDKLGLPKSILFLQRQAFVRPSMGQWCEMIAKLAEDVRRLEAGFVTIDTLPSAWPVLNENDAGEVMQAMSPLRELTQAGAAVLLIHHPRKGDGNEATATRGSGALPGFVDVIVELRRSNPSDEGDRRRLLKAYGRFESTPPEQVIELEDDGYRLLGDRPTVQNDEQLAMIEKILPINAPGLTFAQLWNIWPTDPKPGKTRLRGVLNREFENGRWCRTGSGTKGDPHHYRRNLPNGNAFQSAPSLSERNESDTDSSLAGN